MYIYAFSHFFKFHDIVIIDFTPSYLSPLSLPMSFEEKTTLVIL